jgi:hypothetical protein
VLIVLKENFHKTENCGNIASDDFRILGVNKTTIASRPYHQSMQVSYTPDILSYLGESRRVTNNNFYPTEQIMHYASMQTAGNQ